ncbi:hypothetical protein [Pseudomonas oryzihabitans]|uniref:hypothetical protein n=1 Tax=Pseudomonas oryzihabitans TaxID=47885 RepID=UPI001F0D6DF7|nr:hypothetical protein [Pseudomonas psychrotolerans]
MKRHAYALAIAAALSCGNSALAMDQDALLFEQATMNAFKSCANKAVIAGTRIGDTGRFSDTDSCVAQALAQIEPVYQKALTSLQNNGTARRCLQTYYSNWLALIKSLPELQSKPPSSVLLTANGGERRLNQYWQFVVSAR